MMAHETFSSRKRRKNGTSAAEPAGSIQHPQRQAFSIEVSGFVVGTREVSYYGGQPTVAETKRRQGDLLYRRKSPVCTFETHGSIIKYKTKIIKDGGS